MKIYCEPESNKSHLTLVTCTACNQIVFHKQLQTQITNLCRTDAELAQFVSDNLKYKDIHFCYHCGHKLQPPAEANVVSNVYEASKIKKQPPDYYQGDW